MTDQPDTRCGAIVMVGNARDYHALDWYRSVKRLNQGATTTFLTDLVDSEGHDVIITPEDRVERLVDIDGLLLKRQTRFGGLWRNLVKALAIPLQVVALRRYVRRHRDAVYHAHTMYYMVLCAAAGIEFVGTPQGSEILVRPQRSLLYRMGARFALRRAKRVTVDSESMRAHVQRLAGSDPVVIQNGVDISAMLTLKRTRGSDGERALGVRIISMRGMTPLYRIEEIVLARARSTVGSQLVFVYPFWDEAYRKLVMRQRLPNDVDVGRVSRSELYRLLGSSDLAISIPRSDSSPRSVYEAIFCGCVVAVSPNAYLGALPACMRRRLCVIDPTEVGWFDKAVAFAVSRGAEDYVPSEQALEEFDQMRSARRLIDTVYRPVWLRLGGRHGMEGGPPR